MKKGNKNVLNNKEIKELSKLGKTISLSLSCDINEMGIPCRTDRLEAVKDMVAYITIHGAEIKWEKLMEEKEVAK